MYSSYLPSNLISNFISHWACLFYFEWYLLPLYFQYDGLNSSQSSQFSQSSLNIKDLSKAGDTYKYSIDLVSSTFIYNHAILLIFIFTLSAYIILRFEGFSVV